ncbi:MAG: glycosyltransferase family 2 protein [Gammaproteobacteria bacterium]
MMNKVAIIIVNWKVRDLLRDCLRSVYEHSGLPTGSYEVIVVDNDSGDGSVEMIAAEFPQVHLVANKDNVGFGTANNQAMALTNAPMLLLLNPDTVVIDGALAGLVQRMENEPNLAIIGCRLVNADGTLQRWTGGSFPNLRNVACHYLFLDHLLPQALRPAPLYLNADVSNPIDIDWVSGACMVVRREALQGQLFDPRFFMYSEDMELCQRVIQNGWKVSYDPRFSIIHYQGASIQQQSSDIMLSSLKGPRYFFQLTHGPIKAIILDILTLTGFCMRWAIYEIAALLRTGKGFDKKARLSKSYLALAWQVMLRH